MEQQQFEYLIGRLEAIDGKYDEKLDRILEQTTRTNGRVTSLEGQVKPIHSDVELLKSRMSEHKGRDKTVWVVLCVAATVIGFLFQYYLTKK